jgi:hypothetical protein
VYETVWPQPPKPIEKIALLEVPIPDLGVVLQLSGHADYSAGIHAGYSGRLTNVHVGLTYKQAAIAALVAGAVAAGGLPALVGGGAGLIAWGLHGDFRGLADLELVGDIGMSFTVGAGLAAACNALGVDLVTVEAALRAGLSVTPADLRFVTRVGLYLEGGRLHFHAAGQLQSIFRLLFDLDAVLRATLLGFAWSSHWNLARVDLSRTWTLGTNLDVGYDSAAGGPRASTVIDAGDLPLGAILAQLFQKAAPTASSAAPTLLTPPPTGGPGALPPPTGRTPSDPIPMRWMKPPGVYDTNIQTAVGRYFLTEPDWMPIPFGPGFNDLERDGLDDPNRPGGKAIRIGVSPAGKFFPNIGAVWPRTDAGVVRTEIKQRQFRNLLSAHGYNWGGKEADHVRDLQWKGEDVYENLWPLEAEANRAANQILDQPVTYQDSGGVTRANVPLRSTPLGLYFRISSWEKPQ